MPVNFPQKQERRDELGRFPKGVSGNPAGRPVGSRNAATEMAEALLDGQAGALINKCVELALEGHPAAIKLCLERIVPRRGRAARFALPKIETAADIGPAMSAVARAAADGTITAFDASELSRMVETFARALEISDFDRRLRLLENGNAPVA